MTRQVGHLTVLSPTHSLLPSLVVVEDDDHMRRVVCAVAENLGFAATGLATVGELEDRFGELQPAIVVLDLNIADRDAVDALSFLAERNCKAPVLAMSGCERSVLAATVRLGDSFGLKMLPPLSKPFEARQLRKSLADVPAGMVPLRQAELLQALEERQFCAFYQPKISLPDRKAIGAEALVRWNHPDRGLVSPAAFIPLAESSGVILPLTHMVLDAAIAHTASLQQHAPLSVAVNVSARCFEDPEFPETVKAILRRHQLPPDRLMLEVTETTAMADPKQSLRALTRLRIQGVQLSLDDFGTGFSSLVELHRMPFNELKLDRSFVELMDVDPEACTIITAMINLAHNLGMSAVAEGVENEALLQHLTELGCDIAQGYHIARPMPETSYDRWLDAWTTETVLGNSDVMVG